MKFQWSIKLSAEVQTEADMTETSANYQGSAGSTEF